MKATPAELVFDVAAWRDRVPFEAERARREAAARERWASRPDLRRDGRPIDGYLEMNRLKPDYLVGPLTLAIREQAIERLAGVGGGETPVDVFVWGRGEGPRRDATKYGGLPYWPKSKPWPERDGEPRSFLGQLRVAGSRDLFPDALGDVALVFGEREGDIVAAAQLEWMELTSTPLVDAVPVPLESAPVWAQIHRTVERTLGESVPHDDDRLWWQLEGTKISGHPVLTQPDADLPREIYRATFGSVSGSTLARWPFLDVEWLPPAKGVGMSNARFLWGDMGSAYVIVDGRGGFELEVGSGY